MRLTRSGTVASSIVGLALLASACGGESGAGSGDVQVTLKDFSIDLSTTTVPAGDVTFDASNEGPSVHEFEIFSVPDGVDPTDLPVESNVADTDSQGLVVIDEVEDIAPATTASLTVSLEPGSYALICNLSEHYEQGMSIAITVE
jgi:uncharacterized cupredoxin-like copper-binding protein